VPSPTYGLYDTLAALQGARVLHLPYGADWQLPIDLATAPAKLVFVSNPNNPSATSVSREALLSLASCRDGIVVVDEAYSDFARESVVDAIATHPNLEGVVRDERGAPVSSARLIAASFSENEDEVYVTRADSNGHYLLCPARGRGVPAPRPSDDVILAWLRARATPLTSVGSLSDAEARAFAGIAGDAPLVAMGEATASALGCRVALGRRAARRAARSARETKSSPSLQTRWLRCSIASRTHHEHRRQPPHARELKHVNRRNEPRQVARCIVTVGHAPVVRRTVSVAADPNFLGQFDGGPLGSWPLWTPGGVRSSA
jgi:hypothetical protein